MKEPLKLQSDQDDDSLLSPVKKALDSPVVKLVYVGVGVAALGYVSIVFMDLAAKVVAAYKNLDKTIKS